MTNFEASSYEGELISQSDNEDNKRSIDLNLGIAPPSTYDGQMMNIEHQNFEHSGSRSLSVQPSYGFSMASEHQPSGWNGANFFPISKERAIEKRMETAPIPNWTWQQVQGHYGGGATLIPPFSAAASSGFPSTMIPIPSAAADSQIQFPNMQFLHPNFSPSITNSNTISPFY